MILLDSYGWIGYFSLKLGLGMADAIVYATDKKEGAMIVTSDGHFKGFEDVEFIE